MKNFIIILLLCYCTAGCKSYKPAPISAYKTTEEKLALYRKDPVWIDMMNDPDVNYYEAVTAFDTYWANRKVIKRRTYKPEGVRQESDVEKGGEFPLQYKTFRKWRHSNAPYVQPDGRILSIEERIKIWEKQQSLKEK